MKHLEIEVSVTHISYKFTQPSLGMCMCVCMYNEESTGVTYVFGGFEDGSIVLWDTRQCQKELASIKLFLEPGRVFSALHEVHVICSALVYI